MSSADILGSPPPVEQLTRDDRQALKRKRRAILCLWCSTEREQVFHDLPTPAKEQVPDHNESALSEPARTQAKTNVKTRSC